MGIEYNDGDVIVILIAGDDEDCDDHIGTDADDHTAGVKIMAENEYGKLESKCHYNLACG